MNASPQRLRLIIVLCIAFILSAGYGNLMQIRGARPDLALTTMLVSCLFVGTNTGAMLGFVVGLLEGSYTGMFLGSFLVTRSFAGFVVGSLEERIFRDNVVIAVLTALVGTLLVEGSFFLIAPQPHVLRWLTRTADQSLYNAALAIPVYFIVRRLARERH